METSKINPHAVVILAVPLYFDFRYLVQIVNSIWQSVSFIQNAVFCIDNGSSFFSRIFSRIYEGTKRSNFKGLALFCIGWNLSCFITTIISMAKLFEPIGATILTY